LLPTINKRTGTIVTTPPTSFYYTYNSHHIYKASSSSSSSSSTTKVAIDSIDSDIIDEKVDFYESIKYDEMV
jgi:hypothetical protein